MLTTVECLHAESPGLPPQRSARPPLNRWAMRWALARKELRELAPWILLAVIANAYILSVLVGLRMPVLARSANTIPFVSDPLSYYLFYVAGALALIVGFWQSAWESSRGTFQFLLHRPLDRRELFGVKLAVGAAATFAVCTIPLLIYAVWASTPGTHASPFAWSMTKTMWLTGLNMPLLYFGAFISGIRPARWYGSRLLPLAGVGILAAFGGFVFFVLSAWLAAAWTVACEALVVAISLYVVRTRDFS